VAEKCTGLSLVNGTESPQDIGKSLWPVLAQQGFARDTQIVSLMSETIMTNQQIRTAIRSGWPFFGVSSQGQVMARYVPFGPVFRWERNQMIPTPLQGEDLLWWLQANDEDASKD
jgi:hypothetical protein